MAGTISVEDLLKSAQAYDGQAVSVDGQLIVMYAGSYLCAPSASRALTPDRLQIKLDCPDLAGRCFQVVSPYAGGPWYYHDPAIVNGRFSSEPEPRLTEITSLVIHRGVVDHRVDL
jgi:hypothetical protein